MSRKRTQVSLRPSLIQLGLDLCEFAVTSGHAIAHLLQRAGDHLVDRVEHAHQEVAQESFEQRERPVEHPGRNASLVVAHHTILIDVQVLDIAPFCECLTDIGISWHVVETSLGQELIAQLVIAFEECWQEECTPLDGCPYGRNYEVAAADIEVPDGWDGREDLGHVREGHECCDTQDQDTCSAPGLLVMNESSDSQYESGDDDPEEDTAERKQFPKH